MSRDIHDVAAVAATAKVVAGQGQKQIEEKMVANKTAQAGKEIERLTAHLAQLKRAHAAKDEELKKQQDQLTARLRFNRKVQLAIQKLEQMETPENSAQLKRLKELVAIHEALKLQEARFKENVKRQLEYFKAQIEHCKQSKLGGQEDLERIELITETWKKDSEKFLKLRQFAAKKSREIAMIERKIDEVPSRLELTMYQRQFVELYEQVAVKLIETKRYYCTFNCLVDTHKCYAKEVQILENIQANYMELMKSKATREKFVESMESIVKQVSGQTEDRVAKLAKEKERNAELTETLKQLSDKERAFYKATREFQEMCAENEQLEAKLAAAKAKPAAT
eukprot:TRINITY_DN3553_c0_g1_i1.p1 TRINITY_DN3553_c0_g1~~TRINITY_DN3553_c0_g1_i1.p1  ORF type:complete len:338 (-),score=96.63 TRINITY_DN3553_c0_g1_i1:184-1197(-)